MCKLQAAQIAACVADLADHGLQAQHLTRYDEFRAPDPFLQVRTANVFSDAGAARSVVA
jgi:hypothetical protein